MSLKSTTSSRVASRWISKQSAGSQADIDKNFQKFVNAYADYEAVINKILYSGWGPTENRTRKEANQPWLDILTAGEKIADGLLSTRSVPPRGRKWLEMAYRLFSTSRRMPKDVLKWWTKNQKLLRHIIDGVKGWPVKEEGGDELFTVGSLLIHNTVGATGAELESLKKAFTVVSKLVKKNVVPGFTKALYGDVHVVARISEGHHGAWYRPGDDSLYLRRSKKTGIDEVHAMIHELGHRYWAKFASSDAKRQWSRHHHTAMGKPAEVTFPEVGQLVSGISVPGTKGDPRVSRIDGSRVYFDSVVRGKLKTYSVTRLKLYSILRSVAKGTQNFPTRYSATSEEEHFCESLALLSMGKLSDEHKSAFEEIWG